MIAPARTAAYQALLAIATGRRDLPSALAEGRQRLEDERDRSLAAAIVLGTLRWQRACDHLTEQAARRPVDTLDAEVLTILRLSLFQLLHLDRVPASAVVDDAVNLTRGSGRRSATGFVNAVLRSTVRHRHALPLPRRPDDPSNRDAALGYLGITLSHPDWLVTRWLDRVGFERTERWLRFNNTAAPLTLSVNRLRAPREDVQSALVAEGVRTEATTVAPHGLVVVSGNPLQGTRQALFLVQDEASQLIPLVVDAGPEERVLDLCAAPGGKTVAISGDMRDTGLLVACDVRPRRVRLLRDTIRKAGCRHARPVQVAAGGPLPFSGAFDRVLVDAPCSGLGTVRRDPDIKWRRREHELPGLAGRQLALLDRAARVVRSGGRLVYATCSSEPDENEQVVDAFLQDHRDFDLVDLRASGPQALASLVDGRGMLRTHPFTHGLEAFYAAALQKVK
jgi:16S rRNA (cytosine967-C5)-methyltransferase